MFSPPPPPKKKKKKKKYLPPPPPQKKKKKKTKKKEKERKTTKGKPIKKIMKYVKSAIRLTFRCQAGGGSPFLIGLPHYPNYPKKSNKKRNPTK